jgi:hypothetical protein
LAETFKGSFNISKIHSNGIALIRTKNSKYDHLVNTNLLVKHNVPPSFVNHQNNQNQAEEEVSPRKYNKRIFQPRLDGGPVTRSKMIIANGGPVMRNEAIISNRGPVKRNKNTLNQINLNLDYKSVEMADAVNLIKSWDLIDPIERFEAQMAFQKPENLIKKRLHLA